MTSVATDRRKEPQYDEYMAANAFSLDDVLGLGAGEYEEDILSSDSSLPHVRKMAGMAIALMTSGLTGATLEPVDSTDVLNASGSRSEQRQVGVSFGRWTVSSPVSILTGESWASTSRNIAQSLGRLNDGWMGEGSRCPSDECIAAILKIGSILPSETCEPDCEIDEDTGNVTFRWLSQQEAASFALVIMQDGAAVAVITTHERTFPALPFSKEELSKIARIADDGLVSKLIST